MLTVQQVAWRIKVKISHLEEKINYAETVEEVNKINYAIDELECLLLDFQD